MPLSSRLGFGLALSLVVGLGAPVVVPAISDNVYTKNSFASSLAQAQTAQAQTPAFSDVPADYWAQDYIAGLTTLNIISGFGDGTFRPDEPVTRAQFAAILRKAFLQSQPTTAKPFADVPSNYWATDAIYAARSSGFLSGYPRNRFAPNEPITRRDALVSLASGLKYADGDPNILSYYGDADNIPDYALPKIRAAAKANIIVSYPNIDYLSLNEFTSRADVAAFVYQALVKADRLEPLAAIDRWQRQPIVRLPTISSRMSLSQTGQQLATIPANYTANGMEDGKSFQLWNIQTGQLIKEITAPEQTRFDNIAISNDGKQVAVISTILSTNVRQLSTWAVATGEPLWQKPLDMTQQLSDFSSLGLPTAQVTFTPDNSEIAISLWVDSPVVNSSLSSQLRFYQTKTGETDPSLDIEAANFTLRSRIIFSPDSQFLAGIQPGFIGIWQRNKNNQFEFFKKLPTPEGYSRFLDVVFTDNSTLNISTLRGEGYSATARLDVWNFQTDSQPSLTTAIDWYDNDSFSSLSPDGKFYFVAGYIGGQRLRDIQTESAHNIEQDSFPSSAVFSEDGNRLAIATDKSTSIFTKINSSTP